MAAPFGTRYAAAAVVVVSVQRRSGRTTGSRPVSSYAAPTASADGLPRPAGRPSALPTVPVARPTPFRPQEGVDAARPNALALPRPSLELLGAPVRPVTAVAVGVDGRVAKILEAVVAGGPSQARRT